MTRQIVKVIMRNDIKLMIMIIRKIALVIIENDARRLVKNFVLSRYDHCLVILAMLKMAARFVDVLELQIEQFCFIFSNNHQCNFTKTISHFRLCEYRDSHLDFVSVTIRQCSHRLR